MRNATREKAFGLIKLPANPASGHEHESYAYEYALLFTEKGNWQENNLHQLARDISNTPWGAIRDAALHDLADNIVTTDSPDVWVKTIKPASSGEGIIVRLYALAVSESMVLVSVHHFRVAKAYLCDARERNLSPLEVQDGKIPVTMQGTVVTIRLEQS